MPSPSRITRYPEMHHPPGRSGVWREQTVPRVGRRIARERGAEFEFDRAAAAGKGSVQERAPPPPSPRPPPKSGVSVVMKDERYCVCCGRLPSSPTVMSESAEIIIAALRSFDCAIPEDGSVTSFDDFGPELTVAVAARCLNLLGGGDAAELKTSLPKNLAARHRACAALGKRLKDAGYPGECGYNQFLYPNWRDVKQILTFLVSRVSREGEGGDGGADGGVLSAGSSSALLNHNIQACLKAWQRETWVPPFCATGRGSGHWLRTDPVIFCDGSSGDNHPACPLSSAKFSARVLIWALPCLRRMH